MALHVTGKTVRKVGAAVESVATLGSAAVGVTVSTIQRGRLHGSGCHAEPLLLPSARDRFEGPRRWRALWVPWRALDTLEPYAWLHLDAVAARDLVPKDDGMLCHTSDPLVEVYLNDTFQGSSEWKCFTNSPTWDFNLALGIHSPHSVVQVKIVDRDNLKANDLIGFVELSIADLEPNVQVSGWFELRTVAKLVGRAPTRLRRHMRCRDDDASNHADRRRLTPSHQASNGPQHLRSTPPGVLRDRSTPSLSTTGTRSETSRQRLMKRWGSRKTFCCGKLPDDDVESNAGAEEHARFNAGEVFLVLRLEAKPSDEWYAFGFPVPAFTFLPNQELDLAELVTKIMDTKNLLVSGCQKALCIPHFVVSWKCWPLTLLLLLSWCLACLRPLSFLPVLPLWIALLVLLLRQEPWSKTAFWYSQVAPLNGEGFELAASLADTNAMVVWLVRLLSTMGKGVADMDKLHEFAGLVFRGSRPMIGFDKLVELLEEQAWAFNTKDSRTCHEGHTLVYKGIAASETWTCRNHGGCQHPLTNKFKCSVSRYRCESCKIDICEPCVARRGGRLRWCGHIPLQFLPRPLLCTLTRLEEPVEGIHKAIDVLVDSLLTGPFSPGKEGDEAFKRICARCLCTSAGLMLLVQFFQGVSLESIGTAYVFTWKLTLVAVAAASLLAWTPCAQFAATCLRATIDFRRHRQRRAAGGCKTHWAFFRPDPIPPRKLDASRFSLPWRRGSKGSTDSRGSGSSGGGPDAAGARAAVPPQERPAADGARAEP